MVRLTRDERCRWNTIIGNEKTIDKKNEPDHYVDLTDEARLVVYHLADMVSVPDHIAQLNGYGPHETWDCSIEFIFKYPNKFPNHCVEEAISKFIETWTHIKTSIDNTFYTEIQKLREGRSYPHGLVIFEKGGSEKE